ncbi:MAG: hypothetical protein GY903_06125 [Fuerstiella sp.]|nr:hypothetical protein [Fuerstiella sp.]MCP4854052.1 hypothetical protein [Fuerstiella sp.]
MMPKELEETIKTARIINHARGYFAAVLDCTKFVSERNRDLAIARLMADYEKQHPEYVKVKNDN